MFQKITNYGEEFFLKNFSANVELFKIDTLKLGYYLKSMEKMLLLE